MNLQNRTTIFVAVAKPFQGSNERPAKLDKNQKAPIVLDPYCGESPRSLNVLSGTVAEGQLFEVGKKYEVKAVHMGQAPSTINPDKMVESFNFSNMGEISSAEAREWRREEPLTYIIAPEVDDEYKEIGGADEPVKEKSVANKI